MADNTMRNAVWAILACSFLAANCRTAGAVVLASDSASNAAYAAEAGGAWKGVAPGANENPAGNDNGGTGFEPWNFSGGYHLAVDDAGNPGAYGTTNHFIDGVDFPTTSYNNLAGPAFGLANVHNYGGITTTARRGFTQALAVGDSFSVSFDTPANYDDWTFFHYPFAIITFADAAGTETLGMSAGNSASFGTFPWVYKDAGGEQNLGTASGGDPIQPTDTSDGSSLKLEVTSATTSKLTFDGRPSIDVTFAAGLPKSVTFSLFQNNAVATTALNDFDNNSKVDAADYVLWRENAALQNETETIGSTTPEDYTAWRASFGSAGGPTGEHAFYFNNLKIERPSGSGNGGAVPEPSSLVLLAIGVSVLAPRGRR